MTFNTRLPKPMDTARYLRATRKTADRLYSNRLVSTCLIVLICQFKEYRDAGCHALLKLRGD